MRAELLLLPLDGRQGGNLTPEEQRTTTRRCQQVASLGRECGNCPENWVRPGNMAQKVKRVPPLTS